MSLSLPHTSISKQLFDEYERLNGNHAACCISARVYAAAAKYIVDFSGLPITEKTVAHSPHTCMTSLDIFRLMDNGEKFLVRW